MLFKQAYRNWFQNNHPGLTERFNNRLVSVNNQYTITELNQQFLLDNQHNLIRNRVAGAQNPTQVDPRNWIVKNHRGWKGWNPHTNSYFAQNIEYEDVLKFDQFRHLIIQDKESKALNLILTIQNLIEEGEKMSLGTEAWIQLWLQLLKDYIPLSWGTLSRYSNDFNQLFACLVSLINSDIEIAKVRNALTKVSRSLGENVAIPVQKIKSLYVTL